MPGLTYPLVCFDLDGTLVDDTVFIWKTLHETCQTDPVARKEAAEDYFAGRITYADWFAHDLKLLRAVGATWSRMKEIIHTLTPMPGAFDLLDELKSRGHTLAIVSGSLDFVVKELFGEDRFDYILINQIEFDREGSISGGTPTPFDFKGKADGLAHIATELGLTMDQTVFVGDNDNDLWIARAAGLSIAFNCKSAELREVCDVEVKEKDLRLLVDLIT